MKLNKRITVISEGAREDWGDEVCRQDGRDPQPVQAKSFGLH